MQFEYMRKIYRLGSNYIRKMDYLGKRGWEAVSVTETATHIKVCYKREI